jgi:regulator of protease activity HflC (stomatin/prohibitin superfamily)
MKKLLLTLMLLSPLTLVSCSKVPAGTVGIKVHLLGGDKGVDTQELSPGLYWIGMNEDLYTFPTFTQNYTWTKDDKEGSPNDESITFQTKEGLSANADIGISYHIQPEKTSVLFQKYRKGVREITDVYIRNMVRDSINIEASTQLIESVYGSGKADLITNTEKRIQHELLDTGIVLEHLYWIGEIRLPPSVVASLTNKVNASQISQQKQQEIEQAKADALKAQAVAEGEANAKLTLARADAEAIRLRGEAIKNNPSVVQLNAIERWDGHLPQITSGATPFVDLTKK